MLPSRDMRGLPSSRPVKLRCPFHGAAVIPQHSPGNVRASARPTILNSSCRAPRNADRQVGSFAGSARAELQMQVGHAVTWPLQALNTVRDIVDSESSERISTVLLSPVSREVAVSLNVTGGTD